MSQKAGFHIPSLDGLRTVSFGLVFASHAGLDYIVPGGFGVTVFFFLSGFLITTLLRSEFERTRTVSLRNFYVRRALRILPPFYLVLLVASSLTLLGVIAGHLEAGSVLAQALHYANYRIVTHGFGGFATGTAVYWSLAVEEHFYLLFPLLYLSLRRREVTPKSQAGVILGLCVLSLVWRCVLVYLLHASENRTYVASDTRFDSILYGCALAIYGSPVLDEPTSRAGLWQWVLFPLGILGLLASFLIRDPSFRETLRYSLQGVSLIPVFVCAVRFPSWGVFKLLNLRPIAFLGTLTYSLYLVHQVVLAAVRGRLEARIGLAPASLLALALSIGIAWSMQIVIERPFARLRKRFSA